jgi:uncharacterized membrane protein YcaP (DUF421 family)
MVDWYALFSFSLSPVELIVRGTAIYLFLFLVFRFVVPRDVGAIGVADILVLVIIADAAQNGMAGDYKSITDGVVLISTIVFWNMLFDRLAFLFPKFRRFAQHGIVMLVKDGKIVESNTRRQYITNDELMTKLREKGIEKLADVKRAYLESDGSFSVIKSTTGSDAADTEGQARAKPY